MSIIQKSQKALEYNKILTELANMAKTEQSKALCLNLTPFVRQDDIQRELQYTREAKNILDFARDIPIDKIENFTKLREKNEYFIEEELINIAKSMRTFRLIRNFLKENSLNIKSSYHVVDDLSTVALVEKGFGICLMPQLVMNDIPYDVECYPIVPKASRIIGIAAMNPEFMAPAVRSLYKHIVEKYKKV